MKSLVVFSLLATAGWVRAEVDMFPRPFAMDRYRETIAASPFVVETKVTEEPAAPKENPFANLYLRGISRENGKDYVLIQRLGEDKAMRFLGNEPGPDQLMVKTVKAGANFRETKVVMQKGADTGEVGFKEEAITAATAPPRPNGAPPQFNKPGVPPIPGMASGAVRAAQPPAVPAIPRPQTPTAVPLPKPPTSVPAPQTDPNRRPRMRINNN